LAAAFFGLGEALVTSSANALVADLCQERHFGTAMGAFGAIFDVGHAAGPILAGYLLLSFNYWQSFWILTFLLLASVPVFLWQVQTGGGMGNETRPFTLLKETRWRVALLKRGTINYY